MAERTLTSDAESADAGFTLIELLIYMVLAVVVLLIVGGLLINSLTAERTVRDATQTSNTGQLVSRSFGQGVRNASVIWHSPVGVVPELLVVRTLGSAAAAASSCQAWAWTPATKELRTTVSSNLPIPATPAVASWTLLATGVQPVATGTPIFTVPAGTHQVDLNFQVLSGKGKPVRISTTSVSRQPTVSIGVMPSCLP